MEASFCLRELVDKRLLLQSSSSRRSRSPPCSIQTPLERFLASNYPGAINKQAEDMSGVYADGTTTSSLFNTIGLGAVPSGILLNNSSVYEGLVCFGGKRLATLAFDKMHANTTSSSSSNSAAAAPVMNNIIKGQWTAEEDRMLLKLVKQHGVRKWSQIAKNLVGRIGKQCRERWHNHLRPDIKKETWTEEEEKLLVEAHKKYGNRWAEIARHIPGRSENSIKNHWNATKRSQNAKRKSKKKAGQGARSRSSILENYIQTNIAKTPPPLAKSTQFNLNYGAYNEQTSELHVPSSVLDSTDMSRCIAPPTESILNFSTGVQHQTTTEKLLGFSGAEDEDFYLSCEDTCLLLASPEAPSLAFTEETYYDQYQLSDDFFCVDDAQLISAELLECSGGRSGDMDLMEMMSWQMAHTSQSQSQQSTSSSNGSI